MPLVVPGLPPTTAASASTSQNQQDEWTNKLVGKTITDGASDELNFSKQHLPKESRIIEHGALNTQEHVPNRMNIHLAEDGTVRSVEFK